ncbi:hypothetical protein BOH78_1682 [Pichia kudriavzevii]|uniref:Activator of Hsp90 ATPase AHSA1-like N-terminal domain-containing protein n=1 Tax=Pichia kudriavzevii TaxID=4909 RepID=A0A099P8H9_PICKU|nr:hypothetical protein JL09_g421 [Pichia kudriavzevii]MDC6274115.1 SRPBCC domain-containing protein [Lacticaseibacillus paracasei]ONH75446.1 hypothetical protein BOH78_1682 [Pichia kudriavzevii]
MVVQNPNNWHWVDKNCIDWARAYFDEKLKNVEAQDDSTTVKLTSVKKVDGDCEVCQRKGKVISLFDMSIEINYESSTGHKGVISIPEVMYDTEPHEYQFNLDERVDEKTRVLIRSKLIPKIRTILEDFGPTLINVHGSDIQVDEDQVMSTFTKGNQNMSHMKPVIKEKTTFNKGNSKSESKSTPLPEYAQKYNISKLNLSTEFNTTAEQLYITLLDPQRVAMWTRSPPGGIEPKVGAEFKLFGGGVEGKILRLVENKEIEMLWRISSWKQGHYVKVIFTFDQGHGETIMNVSMNGVPVGEEELVEENFKDKYFKAIKLTFGFGAVL